MGITVVEPLYDSVESYDAGLKQKASEGFVPIAVNILPKGFPLTKKKKSTKPLIMVTYSNPQGG